MRRAVVTLMIVLSGALLAPASLLAAADPRQVGAELEKAITEASERYERGDLKPGSPFTAHLADGSTVSFSAEHFDADVDRAFELLEALLKQQQAGTPAPPAPAAAGGTAAGGGTQAAPTPGTSDLDRLMRAEKKTSAAPAPRAVPAPEYSVYGTYRKSHEARLDAEDQAAEADMQHVIAERQAADADRARKMERDQALQVQSMKWQSELDSQAAASVKAAAAWQAEHSPAAYAKSFLGMVIQTTVGAFTGGFLGVVSTNLANKAVRSLFHDKDEAPPLQGQETPGFAPGIPQTAGTPLGAALGSPTTPGALPGVAPSASQPANRADTTRLQMVY